MSLERPATASGAALSRLALRALMLTTGIAALLAAPPVLAQDSSAEEEEETSTAENLGTITLNAGTALPAAYAGGQVASGSRVGVLGNKDVMETPFATVSYTDEYLANREAQDIGSAIGAVDPSVYVPNKRNIYETYYIRGFQTSADDLLFGGLYGLAPNMRGGTEIAERIEVLKGPSTLLYGMSPGGTIAGAVALVPKRAADEDLTRLTTTWSSESLGGVHADISRRFGANKEWGIRANGVWRDGDTPVEDESHGMKMGSLGIDWRGERARFALDAYRQEEDLEGANYFGLSLGTGVTALPDPRGGENSLAAPWAFNTNDTTAYVMRGEVDLTDTITAYAAYGEKSGGYDALITSTTLMNDAGDIRYSATRQKTDGDIQSGEVGLRGTFRLGSVAHDWTIAASHFDSSTRFRTLPLGVLGTTNYANPDFGAAPDLSAWASADYYGDIRQTLTSYVIADTMRFAGDRFQLTLGARYQEVEQGQYYLPSMVAASYYKDKRISPAIAAVYKISDQLSVYGNYIEGLSPGSTAPLTAANPGEVLPPYRSTQIELGAKWEIGSLLTQVALFQIEKPSAYADPVTNIYGVYGEQRNRGIELTFAGEVQPGLRLLGGIGYTDAKITRSNVAANEGKTAAGAPALMAKFGVEYDVAALEGLSVTGNISHTGKRYVNNANSFELPSYTTLDLGARYATETGGRPLVLRATVQNVTDEAYWAGSSLSGGYGAPRTFLLSATVDF